MRYPIRFSLLTLACLCSTWAFAQSLASADRVSMDSSQYTPPLSQYYWFNNCAAAFLNDKMVVDQYSPEGKCVVSKNAIGKLTLSTVYLAPDTVKAVQSLPFLLAVRDGNTKTLVAYSTLILTEVPVQDVLRQCKPGDSIVMLTIDYTYALPHNEILVKE